MPIATYLDSEFPHTKKSITELSKNDKGKSLVKNECLMYCFDDISIHFHGESNPPASADALIAKEKTIYLLEFKGGFNRIITKENFKDHLASCEHSADVTCEHFKNFIFKNADKEKEILKDSLKMKAIESYTTLEKHLFLCCNTDRESVRINLICVVDIPATEILLSASSKETELSNLKSSLARFTNKKDYKENKYFYDEVDIVPLQNFNKYIAEREIPTIP